MYSRKFGVHGMISAFIVVTMLGISAFVMDRAHLLSAPAGIVKVDRLTPVAALDTVTVVAQR